MSGETRGELEAIIKRLEADYNALDYLFRKRESDFETMFNEHHTLIAKIESLRQTIAWHERMNAERMKRRRDRIKTKMLEALP